MRTSLAVDTKIYGLKIGKRTGKVTATADDNQFSLGADTEFRPIVTDEGKFMPVPISKNDPCYNLFVEVHGKPEMWHTRNPDYQAETTGKISMAQFMSPKRKN